MASGAFTFEPRMGKGLKDAQREFLRLCSRLFPRAQPGGSDLRGLDAPLRRPRGHRLYFCMVTCEARLVRFACGITCGCTKLMVNPAYRTISQGCSQGFELCFCSAR